MLDVKIDGAAINGEATLTTLHGNSRSETNTITDPWRIVPVTSKLRPQQQRCIAPCPRLRSKC